LTGTEHSAFLTDHLPGTKHSAFSTDHLTDTKHSAFSTDHLTDTDKTEHYYNQEQHRKPEQPYIQKCLVHWYSKIKHGLEAPSSQETDQACSTALMDLQWAMFV